MHERAPSTTCAFVTTLPRPSKTIPDPRLLPHWIWTTAGDTRLTTFTICVCIAVAEAEERRARRPTVALVVASPPSTVDAGEAKRRVRLFFHATKCWGRHAGLSSACGRHLALRPRAYDRTRT